MALYKILRNMTGDKDYVVGDRRELAECDAAHLLKLGVIEPYQEVEDQTPNLDDAPAVDPEKMEPAPLNKAQDVPQNKMEKPANNKNNKQNKSK